MHLTARLRASIGQGMFLCVRTIGNPCCSAWQQRGVQLKTRDDVEGEVAGHVVADEVAVDDGVLVELDEVGVEAGGDDADQREEYDD